MTQVVVKYPTTTTLSSSLNPSKYGQAVTLTATVTSAGPTPTGTVTFKNGSTSLGSATLAAGVAKITKSTLPTGTLSITATYNGDTANKKSTSPTLSQVVSQATTTTTVTSTPNPSVVGQNVIFKETVKSPTVIPDRMRDRMRETLDLYMHGKNPRPLCKFDMRANPTTGAITGFVYGNNQILCGNVQSTQWVELGTRLRVALVLKAMSGEMPTAEIPAAWSNRGVLPRSKIRN